MTNREWSAHPRRAAIKSALFWAEMVLDRRRSPRVLFSQVIEYNSLLARDRIELVHRRWESARHRAEIERQLDQEEHREALLLATGSERPTVTALGESEPTCSLAPAAPPWMWTWVGAGVQFSDMPDPGPRGWE